jgi:hypothetical protein
MVNSRNIQSRVHLDTAAMTGEVGRVTPCAPRMPETNRIGAICAASAAHTE